MPFQAESTITISPLRRKKVETLMQAQLQQQTDVSYSMVTDFTKAELNDATRRLKTKKAPGKDGVCNEMIEHLGPVAREQVLELYNQSRRSWIFPQHGKQPSSPLSWRWKRTLRKRPSADPSACCLDKTLERMVNKRPIWHLETNNLITKEQTAFRKNRSTEDQLIYLAQSIENAF